MDPLSAVTIRGTYEHQSVSAVTVCSHLTVKEYAIDQTAEMGASPK